MFCVLVAAVVGNRPMYVGSDTNTYVEIFRSIFSGGGDKYEPGFLFLIKMSGFFSKEHEFVFSVIGFLVTFIYLLFSMYFAKNFRSREQAKIIFFTCIFLLSSSWFFVAVANGVRQGLSLSVLYFSICLVLNKKYIYSFFVFGFSVSFHYSSILFLPFFALIFLSFRFVFFVYCLLGFFYFLGVNEIVVRVISQTLDLPIYDLINGYADGLQRWSGFVPELFFYTILWPILFLLIYFLGYLKSYSCSSVFDSLKIYLILCLPYFVFGFGSFSNRYGFIAWFFIPFLLSVLLANLRLAFSQYFILAALVAAFLVFCFKMFGVL
jgi:hypothetical protein